MSDKLHYITLKRFHKVKLDRGDRMTGDTVELHLI